MHFSNSIKAMDSFLGITELIYMDIYSSHWRHQKAYVAKNVPLLQQKSYLSSQQKCINISFYMGTVGQ